MVLLVLGGAGAMREASAGAPVFWVGPAAPCNFNSLATAIGAVPDGSEIRCPAILKVECSNGHIDRIEEYFDLSQMPLG